MKSHLVMKYDKERPIAGGLRGAFLHSAQLIEVIRHRDTNEMDWMGYFGVKCINVVEERCCLVQGQNTSHR